MDYNTAMAVRQLRGFRDYYPENQAKIVYLRDKILKICRLFGYEEFEGPAVESYELYAAKSSDEIVANQAFTFKDRGDQDVALRPELTPTLARMIALKQNELVFPLRWWSWGPFWRYERPQQGRSREFYQWNLDLLGDDSPQADAEILTIAIQFMESLGLTSKDIVFELSDRGFVTEFLAQNGVDSTEIETIFKYLDRRPKLSDEEAIAFAVKLKLADSSVLLAQKLMSQNELASRSNRLTQVMAILEADGLGDWVQTNLAIVRGFTYYTGIVFECSDRAKRLRTILGGGRYANLVASVGGRQISGIGMAMGDAVLTELLESKNLFPAYKNAPLSAVIVTLEPTPLVTQTAKILRGANIATIIYTGEFSKGLKFASRKDADFAVLIGPDEIAKRFVSVKRLATGEQQAVSPSELVLALQK